MLQSEVRLSVATLEIFTEGHKLVSAEVFELNNAVAELFRKCEALQSELQQQISKANEVKQRIETISGNESGDDEPVSDDMLIKSRVKQAKEKQEHLVKRMEALRKKLTRVTTRDLSDKERAYFDEVRALGQTILKSEEGHAPPSKTPPVWKRFEEIKALRDELFSQAETLQRKDSEGTGHDGTASPARSITIPSDIRKAKMAQVMSLLERETALVDAVKTRLERLSVG